MFEFEAPDVKIPNRGDIFGKPKAPIAICMKCNKMFKLSEMQKYYTSPGQSFWLCSKCAWKKSIKEKFNSNI